MNGDIYYDDSENNIEFNSCVLLTRITFTCKFARDAAVKDGRAVKTYRVTTFIKTRHTHKYTKRYNQEKAENNHPVGFDGFFKVFFLENI